MNPRGYDHGVCCGIVGRRVTWKHGNCIENDSKAYGPLANYVKFRVAHALGTPRVSDTYMHHGTCVTHVSWCIPGPLTSGFLWSWCRGKRSWHSRCMRNPQFYVSGKRRSRGVWLVYNVFVGECHVYPHHILRECCFVVIIWWLNRLIHSLLVW